MLKKKTLKQTQKQAANDASSQNVEEESSRSTLKDLVAQVHQLQQTVREKEILIKRNEVSFNFKVCFFHTTLNKLKSFSSLDGIKLIKFKKKLNDQIYRMKV